MRVGMPCKGDNNAEGGKMKSSLIYTTTPSIAEARKIANILVGERLAACVNMFPVESLYRWEGELCSEKETALVIKTAKNLVQDTIKKIKSLHSYKVPCIISFDIDNGDKDFLDWIAGEVKK